MINPVELSLVLLASHAFVWVIGRMRGIVAGAVWVNNVWIAAWKHQDADDRLNATEALRLAWSEIVVPWPFRRGDIKLGGDVIQSPK